ncbi:Acetylornithine deacetylase [Pirellula sp. SH-Sr6A]|uniref:M20 family metallopeptidase n=1 Tax=Pirellula sp. SH-Sr6A TaxID=1632865 RepID=UPI00078B228F|nr:M20 family metallopeptidase [Pirellula sp. SH-Sr6A]AMV32655.1 Acetylornithine deacetylase [Pirellula sp. SH-Sr6A]
MASKRLELIDTLSRLIEINSVNASYEGGPGEFELACWIEAFVRSRGLHCERQPVIPACDSHDERFNVIARLPGRRSDACFLLEAHMDTVSVEGMEIPPFAPTEQAGHLYGRGACDTKGGLAAMLCAFADFAESHPMPPVDVVMACVVDEEYSFQGVSRLCERLQATGVQGIGAIVAEPTELRIVTASKGVLRWKVVTHGVAAHSAKCHLGINAIYPMAQILRFFEEEQQRLTNGESHPLLGPASINVGCIHGGVQVNFVPDRCEIEIDRRLLPGEDPHEVWEGTGHRLRERLGNLSGIRLEIMPPYLVDAAWSVPHEESFVEQCRRAAQSSGLNASPLGVPFGSDASKLGRAGVPTIIFGPGSIDQAHSAVEFVAISQVEQAYQYYLQVMKRIAGDGTKG